MIIINKIINIVDKNVDKLITMLIMLITPPLQVDKIKSIICVCRD